MDNGKKNKCPTWLKERKNAVRILKKHGVTSLQLGKGKKIYLKKYKC